MNGDRDVDRPIFIAVLARHKILLSDFDGLVTVGIGNNIEVIPLPEAKVSYRTLHPMQGKYNVPIHHFYHPELLD